MKTKLPTLAAVAAMTFVLAITWSGTFQQIAAWWLAPRQFTLVLTGGTQ